MVSQRVIRWDAGDSSHFWYFQWQIRMQMSWCRIPHISGVFMEHILQLWMALKQVSPFLQQDRKEKWYRRFMHILGSFHVDVLLPHPTQTGVYGGGERRWASTWHHQAIIHLPGFPCSAAGFPNLPRHGVSRKITVKAVLPMWAGGCIFWDLPTHIGSSFLWYPLAPAYFPPFHATCGIFFHLNKNYQWLLYWYSIIIL